MRDPGVEVRGLGLKCQVLGWRCEVLGVGARDEVQVLGIGVSLGGVGV